MPSLVYTNSRWPLKKMASLAHLPAECLDFTSLTTAMTDTSDQSVDWKLVTLFLLFLLQEMSTASLHYCEMVTALGVLAPGGSFILKAFTLFEHPTICALYLMGALFQQVHVYKPATSKPGNSETYIIGKGFKASLSSPSPLMMFTLEICFPAEACTGPSWVVPSALRG